jgi:hypothetical protein
VVISLLTFLVFLALVIIGGYIAKYFFASSLKSVLELYTFDADAAEYYVFHESENGYEIHRRPTDEDEHDLHLADLPEGQMFTSWLGAFFVGFLGLMQLMATFMFLNPFGPAVRFNFGGRDGDRGSMVLIVLAVIGLAKSLYEIYRLVKRAVKRWGIDVMESVVLEVNEDK